MLARVLTSSVDIKIHVSARHISNVMKDFPNDQSISVTGTGTGEWQVAFDDDTMKHASDTL